MTVELACIYDQSSWCRGAFIDRFSNIVDIHVDVPVNYQLLSITVPTYMDVVTNDRVDHGEDLCLLASNFVVSLYIFCNSAYPSETHCISGLVVKSALATDLLGLVKASTLARAPCSIHGMKNPLFQSPTDF